MNILICGIDGYLGWPLALHLDNRGHKVLGLDDFSRRKMVADTGSKSLTPIPTMLERDYGYLFPVKLGGTYSDIVNILRISKPDAIVHLAEQPSAPYSMIGVKEAIETQHRNILGTLQLLWAMYEVCPEAHLIKLGTMGEYGTPNCDIPEGEIPEDCLWGPGGAGGIGGHGACPMQGLQFPRQPGSFYHLTKVHDSYNIDFCCRNWNMRSTDIMQGPVFGVKTPEMGDDERLITRFDYDEIFGTVINRFCAQAIVDHPLTVYGAGGQIRGYLPIEDSMTCITLAIENPPALGEYRVFNQFERTYSINDLAAIVSAAASDYGIMVHVNHYENPRKEKEAHYYNPHRSKLVELGYKPTTDITPAVHKLIGDILPYKDRVINEVIVPKTRWDVKHRKSQII